MPVDNITILVKLFETLKASTDKNENATQELIKQQFDLVNQIKNLPMSDLKQALKEHMEAAHKHFEVYETTNHSVVYREIKELLQKMNIKVKTMIVVVLVAFTILTGGYVIIKSTVDSVTEAKNVKIEQQLQDYQKEQDLKLKQILERIEQLHSQQDEQNEIE